MSALGKCLVVIGLLISISAAMADEREACMSDAKKFCGPVLEQQDARRACMAQHRKQWSRRCRTAVHRELLKHIPRKRS
jgi:5-methylcytosine-specific restriction endonuclease McrA